MGTKVLFLLLFALLAIVLSVAIVDARGPQPLALLGNAGTAFTYQGYLKDNGTPATGTYDFGFELYDAAGSGTLKGTDTSPDVTVTNGYFTTQIDFGANVFNGDARWLYIKVRPGTSSGSYTGLSPLQPLTPAPIALSLPGLYTQQNATSPNLIGGYSGNSVLANVTAATISGGGGNGGVNYVSDHSGTIGGGRKNTAGNANSTLTDADDATVGGGYGNTASNKLAIVGGGYYNTASGYVATVGGGYGNTAGGAGAFVGGGGYDGTKWSGNHALANASTIGGGISNTIPIDADYATISGGYYNTAGEDRSTVSGGYFNTASGSSCSIGGGYNNTASRHGATIGGGQDNNASYDYATIGGGLGNTASADTSTIGGGYGNHASDEYVTVGGGYGNTASGAQSTVGGGSGNTASGLLSTVPGGASNVASGSYSFAAGHNAQASADGSFTFADSNDFDFVSNTANSFRVRSTGGARFVLGIDGTGATTWSCVVTNGASWSCSSDRNLKENLVAMDNHTTLERLSQVPILQWNAKGTDPNVKHLGPMAQDFHAAFGLGDDDRLINTIDLDGVALSSIQGLYAMAKEKDAQIAAQQKQIDTLEARLAALEQQAGDPNAAPNPQMVMLGAGALALFGIVYRERRTNRGAP